MTSNWVRAHSPSIRWTLIVVTTLLAIAGLCAAFTNNWHAAAAVWNAAFLGKWVECWLLEKVLVDVQLALEAM
jgi:hypothetical protein